MGQFFIPYPSLWISPTIAEKLGTAIWLLLLLIDLTVRSIDDIGVVLGGKRIFDADLNDRLGGHRNTFRRHRLKLERAGFVFTKTTGNAVRQWFVIGCQKHRGKKAPKWQIQLVHSTIGEMAASRPSDKSKILNPHYFEILHKYDISNSMSSGEATNSGEPFTKNGAHDPYIDKNTNNRLNKDVKKERGAYGHSIQPTDATPISEDEETDIPSDVLEIYLAYMTVIGSNSRDPDHDEIKLIGEALVHEGIGNLLEGIRAYESELYLRDGKWRPLATNEFFKRDFYSRFLEKPPSEEPYFPLDDDDIPS